MLLSQMVNGYSISIGLEPDKDGVTAGEVDVPDRGDFGKGDHASLSFTDKEIRGISYHS
jgi:hypothetical protein